MAWTRHYMKTEENTIREYDYEHQAWLVDGKYIKCGHPDEMNCTCYGKLHEGEGYPYHECCSHCGESKPEEVKERYSFGVYAGRLCVSCCSTYRDNCGIGQDQGNPADLDEPYDEEDY